MLTAQLIIDFFEIILIFFVDEAALDVQHNVFQVKLLYAYFSLGDFHDHPGYNSIVHCGTGTDTP